MAYKRKAIIAKNLAPTRGPYSYGVKAGKWIFTSGVLGTDAEGKLVGNITGCLDAEAQTRQAFVNLSTILEELGASRQNVAKMKVYITDFRYFDQCNRVYRDFFNPPYPARASHGKGLVMKDAMIAMDAIAVIGESPHEVRTSRLADWEVPAAQGGTQIGEVFFSSGHMSRDTEGRLFARGDLRAQTEQALDNLGAALQAAGLSFSDVMMINATVPDWYGFQKYNDIFAKYFREPFEARATIEGDLEVEGMLIQFEAVAARGDKKRIVESDPPGDRHLVVKRREDTIYLRELPPALAPHSHAVQVGDLVYLCGQVGYDAAGHLVGPSDIRAQTLKTMENHRVCLEALGGKMDDIVKTLVSITDYRLIPAFNEEYAKFFSRPYPAQTTVVTGLAQERMVLEVEAIAVLGASQSASFVTGP